MKKILFFISLIFLSLVNAKALSCEESDLACARCVYQAPNMFVEYSVTSNGGSAVTFNSRTFDHRVDGNNLPMKHVGEVKIHLNDTFKTTHFVDPTGNKIKCPNFVYYSVSSRNNLAQNIELYYNISPTATEKDTLRLDLHKDSYNNNKFLNGKEESGPPTLSCTVKSIHKDSMSDRPGPDVTIISDGISYLDYQLPANYTLRDYESNIKPALFMVDGELKCPAVYAVCSNYGGSDTCSVSTDKLTITALKPTSGVEDKNANEIQKQNEEYEANQKKKYDELTPNLNVNLNFGGTCGLISADLGEFLQWVLDIIRIAGVVLTVLLGVLDYAKASFASKEDAIKQANHDFSTRIMCLAILLLVPTIIELTLVLFDIGVTADNPTCGLK